MTEKKVIDKKKFGGNTQQQKSGAISKEKQLHLYYPSLFYKLKIQPEKKHRAGS
jgi:hypothetical protein